jgi:penicillin-binding protein 2
MIDEEIIFQIKGKKNKTINFSFKIIFNFIFFAIFLICFFYFLYLQIFLKESLLQSEKKMKYVSYLIFPPRGNILDRNGNLLATSEQNFDIYIDLQKVSDEFLAFLQKQKGSNFFYRGNQLIIRNVKKETALTLMTQKIDGLKVIPSFKRKYLLNKEIGNLIGYLGLPSGVEKDYYQEEFIGKAGIELKYQDYLRGKPGELIYKKEKDNLLKVKETESQTGNNVILTIQSDFQKQAYKIMEEYFISHNYKKGVLIVLNPNTGEIFSLISYPSYDPNWIFEDKEKFLEALNEDTQPLFNKAIGGLYSPGSTIKPIVAAAALEENIISEKTKIYAQGELRIPNPYIPGLYSVFKDNKFHGWTDVRKAIADSVNVFFYVVGGGYPYPDNEIPIKQGLGIYRLIDYWKKFNLGQESGIDFPGEKSGFLPSPETKKRNLTDPIWRLGDTYNVSIGQGDLMVTPLQIALWTSAFTNNKIYKPFLVKKIISPNGKIVYEARPQILKENIIKPSNLKIIQEGMRMTVTGGTAKMLNSLPVEVAGKSGTPEIYGKKKLNAIFTGYFPYSKPEVVMTLLIEEVPIGSVATLPLYYDLVKLYLELKDKF